MSVIPTAQSQSFDWCSFYSLFWNDKGLKCKVNIPDTVLFRYGQLSAWWATNKDGYIQRHTSQSSTIEAIRRHFLDVSSKDGSNYSKYVSISRHGDGRPQLIHAQAFNQLSELLSDRLESGHPDEAPAIETPSVLQAFIQPYQDVRFVTTLINNGTNLTCHTFQRKYSRRYAPMSATVANTKDSWTSDVILGSDADAMSRLRDVEQQMGAVDPHIKMKLRKLVSHIVKYIQQAHNLTVGAIVCEFIRDSSDKIYLLSILRVEWASNAHGHGSGSLAATILQAEPIEIADPLVRGSFDDVEEVPGHQDTGPQEAALGLVSVLEEGGEDGEAYAHEDQGMTGPQSPTSAAVMALQGRPTSAHPQSGKAVQLGQGSRPVTASIGPGPKSGTQGPSQLINFPGGNRNPTIPISVTNSWPSAQHHTWTEVLGGPGNMDAGIGSSSPGAADTGRPRPYSAAVIVGNSNKRMETVSTSPMADRRTAANSAGGAGANRGGTAGFGAGAPARPQTASALGRSGAHINSGVRGAPVIMHQLQKENEMLRDKLMYQYALAEASAEKIRQLEAERNMTSGAFGDRSNEMQSMLHQQREQIRSLTDERDHWRMRAESAESQRDEMTDKADTAQRSLTEERGTALKALKEHQDRRESDSVRIEQLESEVARLSELLQMETTSINALKRQLLEFSDIAERHKATLRDGISEPGLTETMDMVKSLFNDQENPMGEMYAVQKVLVHYHSDMRAIFLFYAQLEANFTETWPPTVKFSQWMLFCKDSDTSDLRANSSVRNNAGYLLLSPTDCQNIFGKYSEQDKVALEQQTLSGNARASVHSAIMTYEMFLAAIIHISARIRRTAVPFLSEGLREYILRYLSKAGRVSPSGLKRGQVRSALQGTARIGESMQALGPFGGESGPNSSRGPSPIPSPMQGGAPRRRATSAKRPTSQPSTATSATRPSTATANRTSTRPSSSTRPTSATKDSVTELAKSMVNDLEMSRDEAASSSIVRELELMDVASAGRHPKEVTRRGGGYDL